MDRDLRERLAALAKADFFTGAAVVGTEEIEFRSEFRPYCEENYCGMYNANYACPPACGSPEEMARRMLRFPYALVLQSLWSFPDLRDSRAVREAKSAHNQHALVLLEKIEPLVGPTLYAGCSCCMLCQPCEAVNGRPCRYPDRRYSCLSAYCVHVKALAERCALDYAAADGRLGFFSLIAFETKR